MQEWLGKIAPTADVTMSVCTGVKHLAKAGLLAGKSATMHHGFYDSFAKDYPEIDVRAGSSIGREREDIHLRRARPAASTWPCAW